MFFLNLTLSLELPWPSLCPRRRGAAQVPVPVPPPAPAPVTGREANDMHGGGRFPAAYIRDQWGRLVGRIFSKWQIEVECMARNTRHRQRWQRILQERYDRRGRTSASAAVWDSSSATPSASASDAAPVRREDECPDCREVWVTVKGKGQRYHFKKRCYNAVRPVQLRVARAKGLTPCNICAKGA